MGACFSNQKKIKGQISHVAEPTLKSKNKQTEYLTIIYWNLAKRSKKQSINLLIFSQFFQLTGLWGDKLFKYFAISNGLQISLSQFINGMIKITKSSYDQKTQILFNFIKSSTEKGIRYKQFLKMLYHYSKPELKEIMTNDGVFVHQSIIPQHKKLQSQKSGIVQIKHEPVINKENLDNLNQKDQFQRVFDKICHSYQDPGTLLQFQTGKITYQISYCNMSQLTKQYASHVFARYFINQADGVMNLQQFQKHIATNKKLFQAFYSVFHEKLWNCNGKSSFIKYIQKKTPIFVVSGTARQPGMMILALNTLIISNHKDVQHVIDMIYLTGVAVNESELNKMIIKDEPEGNNPLQIQFQSQTQMKEWLDQLRPYTNNYLKYKYQILQQVGTGKYSVVYRCRDRKTHRQYALKTVQLDKIDPKQQQAIQNQTEILKILKSPQFVKQIETIITKRVIYIVSQYVYGEDLYEYVRRKRRLAQGQAAFLLGLIIKAVRDLHSVQIIHRDLKPENIMISYRKEEQSEECSPHKLVRPKPQMVKIIDFGFANYFSVLQNYQGVPPGTLGYMSPEILLGQKPSFENDIFSVGCILFFMLRGKHPFSSNNPQGTAIKTVKGQYSLDDTVWKQISQDAKNLLSRLLQSDPKLRISLKQALQHPWFRNVQHYRSSIL